MQAILDYLKKTGEQLDSEIATATGLSLASVRQHVTVLQSRGDIMICRSIRFKDGKPSLEAQELLSHIGPTYVEISPSGEGIRAFAFAKPLAKGLKANLRGVSVELYSNLRYLTVTGHSISPIAIAPCEGFNSIANEIEELRKKSKPSGQWSHL